MQVALIALPWAMFSRPSGALGALTGFLRTHAPEFHVDPHHEYLEVGRRIGFGTYGEICLNAYTVGELVYAPSLYPERRAACIERAASELTADFRTQQSPHGFFKTPPFKDSPTWEACLDTLIRLLSEHLDAYADAISHRYQVFGLSTSFGQMFANLALAQRIKARNPAAVIVLGGSTVSAGVGPNLIAEYPFVDYVVQGEGETVFVDLLRQIVKGEAAAHLDGVVTRDNLESRRRGAPLRQTKSMDELPYPDFDEFAQRAAALRLSWDVPIEGSRGCWWDRTSRTKNPKNTCYFCNLNVQWDGYRHKSLTRLVKEIEHLTGRYHRNRLFFLDNILRAKGVGEFAAALQKSPRELAFFYELRANLSAYEIYELWKAGLETAQFGIEGLSNSVLDKIGKGTSVIRNLQAMKICTDLGIIHRGNLIANFPGCTAEDVAETAHVILRYAYPYEPLNIATFWLGTGSTVDRLPGEFDVKNVRNRSYYLAAVPEEVSARVKFFDLEYDSEEVVDWTPVRRAIMQWHEYHTRVFKGGRLAYYIDGGDYLRLEYVRDGGRLEQVLTGAQREVYLYCQEIRTVAEVRKRFPGLDPVKLQQVFERWHLEGVMFQEGQEVLATLPAHNTRVAAERLARHAPRPQRQPARLPVVQATT